MKRLIALGIFGGLLFFSLTILAQVPQLLNYQGRLTDDAGIPITTSTTLRFSLYQGGDAATPGSGTLVYQEDASVTPDDNGVFSHLIGSGTVVHGTLDSTVFYIKIPVYLEITIDPAGANETLLPRKQIVTVGYSFKSELADDADTVDGQDASAFAPLEAFVAHNHDPDYVNEGQANSVNSSMIVNGTIVDADINASANIAASKIDPTGLDADLLDGVDSTGFVSTAGDDMTGTLWVTVADTYALLGSNTTTTGTRYGIYGQSASTTGRGVYGYATANSGFNIGVYGRSDSTGGRGVYGNAHNSSGTNYGVYGVAKSDSGIGVYGFVTATSGTTYGVYGRVSSEDGYAGYFNSRVHVVGDLTCDGTILAQGLKPCAQPIDNGKKVLLYAMESPEIWFEDFGTAQLVNGQAVVQLESVFTQAANTEIAYFVFPIPNGECNGLYISRKDKNSFEIRELGGGTSSISFDYRIVAKRRGYEEVRFEEFTEPEQPPEEPNLPVEKK